MYDAKMLARAACQMTGESFDHARRRIEPLETWDLLVPAGERKQQLLESVLFSALNRSGRPGRTFGVLETGLSGQGMTLKVADAETVRALLDLLPYRDRRGTLRGVRGLVASEGPKRRLYFTLDWEPAKDWNLREQAGTALVEVKGPHDLNVPALLHDHRDRLVVAHCSPVWAPGTDQGPSPAGRAAKLREVLNQHGTSQGLGSALMRRPFLWDSLAGHIGVRLHTEWAGGRLTWTAARTVTAGTPLHDDRLAALLTDQIIGLGLRVRQHQCGAEVCELVLGDSRRFDGQSDALVVRTVHGAVEAGGAAPGRPLLALGETINSRARSVDDRRRPAAGEVIAVASLRQVPHGVSSMALATVALQAAACWAIDGLRTAIVSVDRGGSWSTMGLAGWGRRGPRSPGVDWHRLRLTPGPGELWNMAVEDMDRLSSALAEARTRFDRVIVLDNTEWGSLLTENEGVDALVLALEDSQFARGLVMPGRDRRSVGALAEVPLSAKESAIAWRQRELGNRNLGRAPLAGLLLLAADGFQHEADDFTEAVEEQLSLMGTPILCHYPDPYAPDLQFATALDRLGPTPDSPVSAAVRVLGKRLWRQDAGAPVLAGRS